MKILHVLETLSPRYRGPVSVLLALAAAQQRAGHQVTVVWTLNHPCVTSIVAVRDALQQAGVPPTVIDLAAPQPRSFPGSPARPVAARAARPGAIGTRSGHGHWPQWGKTDGNRQRLVENGGSQPSQRHDPDCSCLSIHGSQTCLNRSASCI